jgi:hypothetical protein
MRIDTLLQFFDAGTESVNELFFSKTISLVRFIIVLVFLLLLQNNPAKIFLLRGKTNGPIGFILNHRGYHLTCSYLGYILKKIRLMVSISKGNSKLGFTPNF